MYGPCFLDLLASGTAAPQRRYVQLRWNGFVRESGNSKVMASTSTFLGSFPSWLRVSCPEVYLVVSNILHRMSRYHMAHFVSRKNAALDASRL